ncbi:serine/threonine-protein kinase [Tautonia marina]|uniref:serine/threonine-protein kinase n=1 Tax=Tautonia marina TaxID=2653855 RepID=UPI001260F7C6|nr:serine/threonine-protein kinase [Tautonia marina]
MATSDRPRSESDVPVEFLDTLKRAAIVSENRLADIRSKVLAGDYPMDSSELAQQLISEEMLTEYQAKRLLANRPGSLSIGRYVILEKLGAGSMGRVYKAKHRMMDRISALKIIAPEISNNERVVARFQREMRLVGKLDHPNVVRAFDADKDRGILYIAMEYVAGDSLGQRLRSKGRIPAAELVGYIAQAALGLQHAHDQGIVHRDIKPSNLLLGSDGTIKVLDLGLATLMEADDQSAFATADGVAVGTVDYMSPEQAMGKELSPVSDLFSLGCTMYHLLTGRLPYPGTSPLDRMFARINQEPVPVKELRPDLPDRVIEVLCRLMARQPSERYPTAAAAAEALQSLVRKRSASQAVAASPTVKPAPAPPSPPTPPPPPQTKYVKVAPSYPAWFQPIARLAERSAIGALLVLLGLLGFAFGAGVIVGMLAGG